MRNETNLPKHELVGLRLRVVEAKDRGMIGMEGTVVDETRETLVIEEGRTRIIPKRGALLEVTLDDGSLALLRGDDIAYRPEDRVKRASHRRPRGSKRNRSSPRPHDGRITIKMEWIKWPRPKRPGTHRRPGTSGLR